MVHKENENRPDWLITGYLNGELNDEDTRELIKWLKLNQSNKRYFDECSEIWLTAKVSSREQKFDVQRAILQFKQNIAQDQIPGIVPDRADWFKRMSRYAAIFIVAFSLGGLLVYHAGKNITEPKDGVNELTVPLGSRAHISLSDGTEVTLNAGSTLSYDNSYGIRDRVIRLEGEAYFKVARDSGRVFMVRTSHINVTAIGTEFNVKAYSLDKTIEATLVNGSIKVEPVINDKKDVIEVLEPNQKLTFYKDDSRIVSESESGTEKEEDIMPARIQKTESIRRLIKENINVEPVVSWKEDRWIFEQQTLAQIAVELERKFDVQIFFETERLKTLRFTGTITAEPIEQVLEVLGISAPINYKLKGKIVTLSENRNFEELNKNLYNR